MSPVDIRSNHFSCVTCVNASACEIQNVRLQPTASGAPSIVPRPHSSHRPLHSAGKKVAFTFARSVSLPLTRVFVFFTPSEMVLAERHSAATVYSAKTVAASRAAPTLRQTLFGQLTGVFITTSTAAAPPLTLAPLSRPARLISRLAPA
jgi:hypothetical protein